MKKNKEVNILSTDAQFDRCHPLNYYPRPSLKRDEKSSSYLNLNGVWKYEIFKENDFNQNTIIDYSFSKEIIVPYCVESTLSEVKYRLQKDELLCYSKEFKYEYSNDKVLLHFGAVDQKCVVILNDHLIGTHIGGYLPFTFDVTSYIKDTNKLIVIVSDKLSHHLPYGKQRIDNGGMWYTPVSGIWKTVWMESVESDYIESLNITSSLDLKNIDIFIKTNNPELNGKISILLNNIVIKEVNFKGTNVCVSLDDVKSWSPESPILYDIKLKYGKDEVTSYTAFRKVSIDTYNDNKVIYLNNKPYFMHGLLDQGYYPDGIFTPKSIDVVVKDLETIKSLGFNTLRKHIKVEDEMWYYLCDKMGIIVWQDMVNMFDYKFFTDTIVPTILNNRGFKITAYNKKDKDFFIKHSLETIEYLYNHPSIVLWTIFNEGWGEHDVKKIYDLIKFADPTRLIDPYSGWFKVGDFSEFNSKHIYFRKVKFNKNKKCNILSEFGGYSLLIENHHYSKDIYGYGGYSNIEDYNEAFKNLYLNQVAPFIKKGLSATIYTQITDVEDEINGIISYDRKVIKLKQDVGLIVSNALKYK